MNHPSKIYDLTHPIYHNCPGWPTFERTVLNRDYQHVTHGFNAETLSINMHTGTHIDVPFHFFPDGKTVDDFPVDTFAGPCLVFDVRPVKPDSAITPEDIAPFMPAVEPGDIVLLYTGYGTRRGYNKEYLFLYPYLGGPAAEMLAKAGVKGVGTDALSMGGMGSSEKAVPCHETLLGQNIFLIEELLIPEELLDGKKRYFASFPLLMQGCSGSPVRAVVFDF